MKEATIWKRHTPGSKKTQPARGWNATDICTNCVNTTLSPEMGTRIRFMGKPAVAPCRMAGSAPTKAGDVESNSSSTTHTNKHAPVIWICDLCHKQIKKQQTSIRCNHTHNTHWVHLNCTQIKERQYKPDWRCTIHTPIQIVTTTPSTDYTTTHRRQITTQPLTINQMTKTPSYFKST